MEFLSTCFALFNIAVSVFRMLSSSLSGLWFAASSIVKETSNLRLFLPLFFPCVLRSVCPPFAATAYEIGCFWLELVGVGASVCSFVLLSVSFASVGFVSVLLVVWFVLFVSSLPFLVGVVSFCFSGIETPHNSCQPEHRRIILISTYFEDSGRQGRI